MKIINSISALIVASTLLLLNSCGTVAGDTATPAASDTASNEEAWVPPDVQDLLKQNGIEISQPKEGSGDKDAAMRSFYSLYDASMFKTDPEVYDAQIVSSTDLSLKSDQYTEVVVVTDYSMDFPIPTPEATGQSDENPTVNSDMVAFFDASSGDHLVTEYLATPNRTD